MGRITLHIGAGKCGSTAIQSLLTRHPVIPTGEGEARYVVIRHTGEVMVGEEITPGEDGQSRKSAMMARLGEMPDRTVRRMRRALSEVPHAVLSSEGYFADVKRSQAFLARLDLPIEVVAYVRPQVEYLNSAWWQWDAWEGLTRKEWLHHRLARASWYKRLTLWQSMPQVGRLVVRLLPSDIVPDMLGVLGATHDAVPPLPRTNESLPGALLRFFQGHPGLRKQYHQEIMWRLPALLANRQLGPVPWVIDQRLAERIVENARADNEALIGLLDPESAARMRADPRWWDAGAYAERVAEPLRLDPPAQARVLDALSLNLLTTLFDREPATPA